MSCVIEGYNYDIFISYRQKDNKGDMWVSEFVEALKTELESTFKEEISVYFDINPHDGLLETHDVDDSLKEKLKCLIFIPIISRTYCDPKSFAWEHEFKTFADQASKDQFGLKVKLTSGNVGSRVLPVRIYDLDTQDIKLCESVLGGVLRGVEFIYKEAGVNRPLRSNEENPHENLNNTIYRNQINKVANAIKDIVLGLNPGSVSPASDKNDIRKISNEIPVLKEKILYKHPIRVLIKKLGIAIPWFLTALLVAILGVLLVIWLERMNEAKPVYSFIHYLPDGEITGNEDTGSSVTISPDGTTLIFVSQKDDKTFLSQREISELEAQVIPGTDGAESPFFSPDSKWVAFFADGNLKKISLLGGAAQIICEARAGMEGCWGKDNIIIYADWNKACLMKVLATGGTPVQLTTGLKLSVGEGEHSHLWPKILPGGETILFTIWHNSEDMRVVAYSLETGERNDLIDHGSHACYAKTGHLIYAWKGDLLAVPFNPKKYRVTGQPVVILKGVRMNNIGLAHFSISDDGSLVYIPGNLIKQKYTLTLVDLQGTYKSLNIEAKGTPIFSPDGGEILSSRLTQELTQLWIYDIERGTSRRFTQREFENWWAIWTPDGKQIVFNSNMQGSAATLYRQMADGTGPIEKIISGKYHQQPKCWANDGTTLIYTEGINPETGMDIYTIQPGLDTIPKPLINSRFNEIHPSLSPGERWLAYVSDESGREEVFVCSFPDLANRIQISPDGGLEPLWSPDGKKLFYRDMTGDKLMSVSITETNNLQVGKPELLFKGPFVQSSGLWGRNYDISPDGSKFLMIKEDEITSQANQINMIINWSEKLKD